MKHVKITLMCALLVFAMTATVLAGANVSKGSQEVDKLKYRDIELKVPRLGTDVIVDTLPNGIVLFMMEDHRLPFVNIRGTVRTGTMYEPKEKTGLAGLTGTMIRAGGTETREPDTLNEQLEQIAASVETYIDDEIGGASLNCMSKDLDKGIELYTDVLMRPAFRQDKIDIEKDQLKESIRRRNDTPNSIANREYYKLLYRDHFYGDYLEWSQVKAISRGDMIDFYRKYFVPNNLWLGITGDFNMDDIKAKLTRAFSAWQPQAIVFPEVRKVSAEPVPGVFEIEKDVTQSNVIFGLLGINQKNFEDRFAISIMNYILGGGSFTSRMTEVVRSEMGLAYTVGTSFGTGSRDIGTFSAFCQTKSGTTYKAIYNMVDQIRKIAESEVTDAELQLAKDAFINRFVFQFTSPSQIVSQLIGLEYDGMPRDFYDKYLERIRSIKKSDVLRVAKKYLKPDQMTFMIVGKPSDFEKPLDEFGKVTKLPLVAPSID